MNTLVLIDSNAIIHRAYHALPKNMSTSKGELTNAVYGFATTLIKAIEDLKPTHIAASFDVSKSTFRVAQYAAYKATRVAADQELYDQIPKVKELLGVLNIPIYTMEGYEADDVIGTISNKFEIRSTKSEKSVIPAKAGIQGLDDGSLPPHPTSPQAGEERAQDDKIIREDFKVYIISGDKDIFQLIDGNIFVYWLKRGLSEAGVINRKVIEVEWNLQPEDFIDLKALAGDSSDNIPGVPGIGPKTATDLLQRFDTLEKLYREIESRIMNHESGEKETHNSEFRIHDSMVDVIAKELGLKPRIIKLLLEHKDQAFLSQSLATINRNVPIDFDLEACKWGDYDKGKLKEFFERMQFHSLLKRFGAEKAEEPKTAEAKEKKEKDEQLKLL